MADGVGGSARDGVDPGLFSREMLRHCHAHFAGEAAAGGAGGLKDALKAAGQFLRHTRLGGSSTVLLGSLEPSGLLTLLNIGDSAAMLLRPAHRRFRHAGEVVWPRLVLRTHEQTHFFNCPYQLSSTDVAQVLTTADVIQAMAMEGDILIVATDGVTDNLFDHQLQTIVHRHLRALMSPSADGGTAAIEALAQAVANEASTVGARADDPRTYTPFSQHAAMEGYDAPGGKLDDVAVVCAVVRGGAPPVRTSGGAAAEGGADMAGAADGGRVGGPDDGAGDRVQCNFRRQVAKPEYHCGR